MTNKEIEILLQKYSLKPKKYLGQNFLINQKILHEIADAAKIQKNDYIIEIGPGIGNLTKVILENNPKILIVIEKDKNFCEVLKKEFKKYINQKKLIVINEDILKINFENLLKNCYLQKLHGREVFVDGEFTRERKDFVKKEFTEKELAEKEFTKDDFAKDDFAEKKSYIKSYNCAAREKCEQTSIFSLVSNYKIIGNIPYYLTSRLIRKIFESEILPEKIILTTQKEVAQRICAKPPNMNLLALSVQIFARPKILSYIQKENFWPKPKVDSAIIEISPYYLQKLHGREVFVDEKKYLSNCRLDAKRIKLFFKIIKAAFSGKRKQIINTLSKNLNLDKKTVKNALDSLKISEKSRPEELKLEKWINLALFLEKYLVK